MAVPTFNEVMTMKRSELQALCKSLDGVKANGKTEALQIAVLRHFNLVETKASTSSQQKSKPTTSLKTKQSKKQLAEPASSKDHDDEMRLEPSATTTVGASKSQSQSPQIVYATSPSTRKTVAELVDVVKALQGELATTRTQLKTALGAAASTRVKSDTDLEPEVRQMVDTAVADARQAMTERLSAIETVVHSATESTAQAVRKLDRETTAHEQDIVTWRQAIEDRLQSLEERVAKEASSQSLAESPVNRPVVAVASRSPSPVSPTPSDAPPVCSLLGTSEGPDVQTPATPALVRLQASPTVALSSRRSARKLPSGDDMASLPTASALPAHMVVTKTPAKSSQGAHPTQTAEEPCSPARPAQRTIGKHARDSDASELSLNIEVVRSPRSVQRPTTPQGKTPRSVSKSSTGGGGHSRKRQRVSGVSVYEDAKSPEAPVENGEETSFEDSSEMLGRSAINDVFATTSGDYVVKTKTGDEDELFDRPSRTPKSARSSVSDPTFFMQDAFVATRSPASGPRKSLPLAQLPVPLLSPFVPRSNAAGPNQIGMTPKSASRKSLCGGTSASKTMMSASRRSRSQGPVPPTPPAFKTLYGTEREAVTGFDGFSEGPRFGDFVEEPVSVRKSATWGQGLFGGTSMF
ncbi:hypothetical protein ACM66B_002947 [Microbotryomycetes sp. NB124-2]